MGSPRTLINDTIFAIGFNEQTFAADVTIDGATFDRENTLNAAHDFIALVDTGLWVDGTHTIHLEDSPDDSVWTDVVAAEVIVGDGLSGLATVVAGQVVIEAVTNDNSQYIFGYQGAERYVRLSVDSTNTTTGLADVVAWYVGGNPRDSLR